MTSTIKAVYLRKRLYDDGRDNQARPYMVHNFTKVEDEKGNPLPDCAYKDTKLFQRVSFIKGKQYEIVIENHIPLSIVFDGEKYYRKNGNSIWHTDKKGNDTNLSYSSVMQSLGQAKRAYTLKQKRGGA